MNFPRVMPLCLSMLLVVPATANERARVASVASESSVLASAAVPREHCSLSADGVLSGRLISPEGQPLDGVAISLRRGDLVLRNTTTRSDGTFAAVVSAGPIDVVTPRGSRPLQVWDATIAPPSARQQVTLVAGSTAVRGQVGGGGASLGTLLGVGLGVAGVSAGVVAIRENEELEDELDELEATVQDAIDAGNADASAN